MVLSLTLAACSGASSSSSSTSTSPKVTTTTAGGSGAADDQTACALVAPSQIKSTMGVTVGMPIPVVKGSETTCTYRAANLSKSVIIQYDVAATTSSVEADRSAIEARHVTVTSVPALGSAAYSFSEPSKQGTVNSVVTFQGSLQTVVTGTSPMSSVQTMAEAILYQIDAHDAATTTSVPG